MRVFFSGTHSKMTSRRYCSSCGVILDDPTLNPGLAVRVQTIEAIANRMKERLLTEEDAAAAESGKP